MQKLSRTAVAAAGACVVIFVIVIVIVFRMLLMVLLLLLLLMAMTVVMVMPVYFHLPPYLSSGCTSECQLTKYEEISSMFTTLEHANILFDFYMAYACGVNGAGVHVNCVCCVYAHTLYDFFLCGGSSALQINFS